MKAFAVKKQGKMIWIRTDTQDLEDVQKYGTITMTITIGNWD